MDEWRAEHPHHLLAVDDCPFCRVRTLTSGEEPPQKVGTYCMVHGVTDCPEPDCWRCGNHAMDDYGICADPRCRASNGPEARKVIAKMRARWTGPIPMEVLSYWIGICLLTSALPSSSPDGAAAGTEAGTAAPDDPGFVAGHIKGDVRA